MLENTVFLLEDGSCLGETLGTLHMLAGKCVNRGSPTTCISLILKPYLSASENCISVFSSETDLGNCVTICADDVIDWISCSCSIMTCENNCWMLPFPYFCRSQLLSSLMQQSDYCTITKCEFSEDFLGSQIENYSSTDFGQSGFW